MIFQGLKKISLRQVGIETKIENMCVNIVHSKRLLMVCLILVLIIFHKQKIFRCNDIQ